jgi:hypothetical protein
MSRLDTGLHLHALVARMDRPPPSKRTHAGSNPAESSLACWRTERARMRVAINNYGELAERQGIAVLTRRDLRVGQVRLLHSPPPFLRVWHRRMCIGFPNRPGEIVTRGPLQFAPLVYRLESRSFKPKKRARHPYGVPDRRDAGVAQPTRL